MAMQFVAAQMMSAVWNGASSSQMLKPHVRNGFEVCPSYMGGGYFGSLHLHHWRTDRHERLRFPWQSFSPSPSMSRIQTDVSLPSLKKLAPPDSKTKERLFVVFSPSPLPPDVLEDVFW